MNIIKPAWDRGFADGEKFVNTLPYPEGTPEAESWRQGWVEGMLKALLLPYYTTPEFRDIFMDANPDSEEAEWRRLLRERLDRRPEF